MCGIAGFVAFDPPRSASPIIEEMLASLRHRGPDDQGRFISPGRRLPRVALANTRLAIIDLAGGKQPVFSESKDVVAVFNGEIYNYKELRRYLESSGHRLASASDTEVIPHLFEEFGIDFLHKLRGMFAIALYDGSRLYLARDRFGIKPMYYAELEGGGICFASEPRALASMIKLAPEPALIPTYLSLGYIPAPLTPYKSVRKLEAGTVLVFDGRKTTTQRWWEPAHYFESRKLTTSAIREALQEAVRAHLVSDVPIGVFASGGIDSSVVSALAAREARGDLIAFTVGFKSRGPDSQFSFDERRRARDVARQLGVEHVAIETDLPSEDELFDLAVKYGEPIGDEASLPTYAMARAASEHVKVVLTGEGGDELFGGYDKYRTFYALRPLMAMPLGIHKAIGKFAGLVLDEHRAQKIVRILSADLIDAGRTYDEVVVESLRRRILSRDVRSWPVVPPRLWSSVMERKREGALDPQWVKSVGEGNLSRYLLTSEELASLVAADICGYLADGLLHKVDSATMAHGLEARVPYLDHELFEEVGGVALLEGSTNPVTGAFARLLVPGRAKAPLRQVAKSLLPNDVVYRRKQGFAVPLTDWIARFQNSEAGRVLVDPKRLSEQGYWNVEEVSKLFRKAAASSSGRNSASRHLSRAVWLLLAYQMWLDSIPRSGRQER